jgi:hypothetical protein
MDTRPWHHERFVAMESLTVANVPLADARRVREGPPSSRARPDWSRRRAAPVREVLADATVTWIHSLPAKTHPRERAERYSPIANQIAALWEHPTRCAAYLSDPLIVRRSNRQGFPILVARVLGTLTLHHATLHPFDRPWPRTR